jgi:hypothetical protein
MFSQGEFAMFDVEVQSSASVAAAYDDQVLRVKWQASTVSTSRC